MLSSLYISQMIDYIDGIPFEGPAIDPYIDGTLSVLSGSEFTQVGPFAFYSCSTLEAIDVPAYGAGSQAFENCTALSEAVFNNSNYTYIYTSAFKNCTSLAMVSGRLYNIYPNAFNGCTSLMSLYISSDYCMLSNSNAFANTPIADSTLTGEFGSIYVPFSAVATFQSSSVWSYFSERFVGYDFNPPISGITPTLRDMVEQGRSAFTALYEPSASVVGYGNTLFAGTSLSLVSLPEVEAIWSGGAFGGCTNLREIFLPKCSVIYQAFQGCGALTELSLPACEGIYDSAFNGCTGLQYVSLPSCRYVNFSNWFGAARNNLKAIYCPSSVVYFGHLAGMFNGCSNLSFFEVPYMGTVSSSMFTATGLSRFVMMSGTYINTQAFGGCSKLTELYLGYYNNDSTYSYVIGIDYGSTTFALGGTPIQSGEGVIYVPSTMLSAYQSDYHWSSVSAYMQPWDPETYVPATYTKE